MKDNLPKDIFFPSEDLTNFILDSIDQQITVIDSKGNIKYVNQYWCEFFIENGGDQNINWLGQNYLSVCNMAAEAGDQDSLEISNGLKSLIHNKNVLFTHEYPCHSPSKKSWYLIKAFPLKNVSEHFVIVHFNITNNKMIQNRAYQMSLEDPLTGLYNRRGLERKSTDEFSRAMRSKSEISVCMFDIDNFKIYNDTLGHQAGDECLKAIANEIKLFAQRPGDIAARMGGDEFILILSNTSGKEAVNIATKIKENVLDLNLPLPGGDKVTLSGGVTSVPAISYNSKLDYLYKHADSALYDAKKSHNAICFSYPEYK